jgi:ATP-binding cassette subfamily C protein
MSRAPQPSGVAALIRDYRHFAGARLWASLALMVLGAIAEGFGLLMIVPLAAIALGQPPRALGRFTGWIEQVGNDQRFVLALALFAGAMAARSALLYARDVQLARLQAGYEASLRLRAAATLARRGWPFASRIGQARMQSLLLTDVSRASIGVGHAQHFLVALVMLSVQFLATLLLSPTLALIALAIMLAGSLSAARWNRRAVHSGIGFTVQSEASASSGFRLHAGLKAALAQGTVPEFIREYGVTLDRARSEAMRFYRDLSSARQWAALGAGLAAAVLLFVGVRMLTLPFPVLITSLALFARMASPAQVLQQSAQSAAAYAPSFVAIEQRLGRLEPPPNAAAARQPLEWRKLDLDGVSFEHQPRLGLKRASFTLAAGEWIGVSGRSGSGKTTLVDLVAGLLAPTGGAIRVDDRALERETMERWRAGLAYVGQDGSVFNDSVRGNLLAEGAAADDQRLWQALELAGLADRIRMLPGALDESVGDRGSRLSGGERQRLAIARALLRRPTLLILDEATAALDADSEAELLRRLRTLEPRPAAIVVAHRAATLDHCDSTLSIQHGVVKKSAEPTG